MAAAAPVTADLSGRNGHGDSAIDVTVTASEWVTVTEAMTRLGVTRRTVRRWIAAGSVVSRLEEQDGREVRLIRGDTLPAVAGDGQGDATEDSHGDILSLGAADATSDDTGDSHRDAENDGTGDLVRHQAEEISFLRAQLEARAVAEAELRRLLLLSQQALNAAIERPMLPAAGYQSDSAPPARVKWWQLWRRKG